MTKESSERRVALLIALLGSVGIGFDKVIHVDTCKQLLESLSKEDMSTFVNHCYGMLLQPLEEKDGEDKEDFKKRAKEVKYPVVEKLFREIAPKYKKRAEEKGQGGGYTRLVKKGPRRGDSAEMVILELV